MSEDGPMLCRHHLHDPRPAVVGIRSGLEWHPECAECAKWWGEHRHGPLSEVAADYHETPEGGPR